MEQTIRIEHTDLRLSPLGFGTVDAGLKWDGREADVLFDTFLDVGGNLIDTARVYSDWVPGERGRSERVVGDWLRRSKKRNQVILSTKGGHPDMTLERPDMHQNRLSRKEMRKDLELSLQTLGVETIDLYFYHRDQEGIPVEDLLGIMEDFVREGKIRYYACSNFNTSRLEKADACAAELGYCGFSANQALYNLGSRYMSPPEDDTLVVADEEMLDYHRSHPSNLLMPYLGNCGGYFHLLEAKGPEAVEGSPYDTPQNRRIAKGIKRLREAYQASLTQVVLGFFTQQPCTCLPLYGASKPERIVDAAKTFEITFRKEDFECFHSF